MESALKAAWHASSVGAAASVCAVEHASRHAAILDATAGRHSSPVASSLRQPSAAATLACPASCAACSACARERQLLLLPPPEPPPGCTWSAGWRAANAARPNNASAARHAAGTKLGAPTRAGTLCSLAHACIHVSSTVRQGPASSPQHIMPELMPSPPPPLLLDAAGGAAAATSAASWQSSGRPLGLPSCCTIRCTYAGGAASPGSAAAAARSSASTPARRSRQSAAPPASCCHAVRRPAAAAVSPKRCLMPAACRCRCA